MVRPFLALCVAPCLAVLAGCAGNVADYVGSRSSIVTPQFARFGLDATQQACLAGHFTRNLSPLQLRRFVRVASVVRQGYYDPPRLTPRDLLHVAGSMPDPQVRLEMARGMDACSITTSVQPAEAAPAAEAPPTPSTAARPPSWLNLGAAPTGQSIAVDASSLVEEGTVRRSWFRLTNPNQPVATGVSYLLRIDCTARTIEALAHRRHNPDGSQAEQQDYPPDAAGPLPVEGGTVMEIAYLALCT
jgi:hypothetical protein